MRPEPPVPSSPTSWWGRASGHLWGAAHFSVGGLRTALLGWWEGVALLRTGLHGLLYKSLPGLTSSLGMCSFDGKGVFPALNFHCPRELRVDWVSPNGLKIPSNDNIPAWEALLTAKQEPPAEPAA